MQIQVQIDILDRQWTKYPLVLIGNMLFQNIFIPLPWKEVSFETLTYLEITVRFIVFFKNFGY